MMRFIGKAKIMSRLSVDVVLSNYEDMALARRGDLDPAKVRRAKIRGIVDSGASRLVLPKAVVKELGLPVTGRVKVKYADGRIKKRPVVQGVHLQLQGRDSVFKATVEPKRDTALIGALVLEDLDFLVDCAKEKLVPRDPKYIVAEIE